MGVSVIASHIASELEKVTPNFFKHYNLTQNIMYESCCKIYHINIVIGIAQDYLLLLINQTMILSLSISYSVDQIKYIS